MSTDLEGVIRFQLLFQPSGPPPVSWIRRIRPWRNLLFRLQLIGMATDRYDGLGYGNISEAVPPGEVSGCPRAFVVSGSQTGHIKEMQNDHFAVVTGWDLSQNRIESWGVIPPSSESLTHAAIYSADGTASAVIHVHAPELWSRVKDLGLPMTDPSAACGTPEMAREVYGLLQNEFVRNLGVFGMGGHPDGMISFGPDPETAGCRLIRFLAHPEQ